MQRSATVVVFCIRGSSEVLGTVHPNEQILGGKLARTFQTNKERVLFPVGLQYGWNVYDKNHRDLLIQTACAFRPKLLVIHLHTTRVHALSDSLPRGLPDENFGTN